MAKMGGCNDNIAQAGKNSTRIDPKDFARNNLAKGGVNEKMANSGKTSTGTAKRK